MFALHFFFSNSEVVFLVNYSSEVSNFLLFLASLFVGTSALGFEAKVGSFARFVTFTQWNFSDSPLVRHPMTSWPPETGRLMVCFTLPDTVTVTVLCAVAITCRTVHITPSPTPLPTPIKCRIVVFTCPK